MTSYENNNYVCYDRAYSNHQSFESALPIALCTAVDGIFMLNNDFNMNQLIQTRICAMAMNLRMFTLFP